MPKTVAFEVEASYYLKTQVFIAILNEHVLNISIYSLAQTADSFLKTMFERKNETIENHLVYNSRHCSQEDLNHFAYMLSITISYP